MSPVGCETFRRELGSFIDGELSGAERRRLSQHLDLCEECSAEVEVVRTMGGLLRRAAAAEPVTPRLAGLAGGVVARVRAESAQSWRALFTRGFEDWHWIIVGGGSVAATFVSTVLVSALLLFGPAPEREDSLAALVSNLESSAGTLWLEASRARDGKDLRLMQVDTGDGSRGLRTIPAVLGFATTERDLVGALAEAVARKGRLVELASMPESERRYTESLLDKISRLRLSEPYFGTGPLNIHRIRLVTSTGVSAKALQP